MREKYSAGLTIAAVYIGAVMGAGFATGQELMSYFVRFGAWGLAGIATCGGLFAFIGFKVLYFMYIHRLESYREFLQCVMGKRFGAVTEMISFCFITALYSAMLSAAGALGNRLWNINGFWVSLVVMLLCTGLVAGGVRSFGTVNLVLCPLLTAGSVLVGLWLYFGSVEVFAPASRIDDNLLGSVVVYISYNMISCISVLCAVSKKIVCMRDALVGAVVGGLVTALIGVALALPVYKYFASVATEELPILALISDDHIVLQTGYAVLLGAAILTTAVGNCYSAVECLCSEGTVSRLLWGLVVGIAALIMAQMGFRNIVGRLYYVFGCLGIAELCCVVCLSLKKEKI